MQNLLAVMQIDCKRLNIIIIIIFKMKPFVKLEFDKKANW